MEERKITNPVKAIRAKCLDCCSGSVNEVKLCPCETCALWPFREGKNPYRKKYERTPEQIAALVAAGAKARKTTTVSNEKNENPAAVKHPTQSRKIENKRATTATEPPNFTNAGAHHLSPGIFFAFYGAAWEGGPKFYGDRGG